MFSFFKIQLHLIDYIRIAFVFSSGPFNNSNLFLFEYLKLFLWLCLCFWVACLYYYFLPDLAFGVWLALDFENEELFHASSPIHCCQPSISSLLNKLTQYLLVSPMRPTFKTFLKLILWDSCIMCPNPTHLPIPLHLPLTLVVAPAK